MIGSPYFFMLNPIYINSTTTSFRVKTKNKPSILIKSEENNMSMRSSFIYGFGFNNDCDEEKLIDFIKEHKEAFCKSDREKE